MIKIPKRSLDRIREGVKKFQKVTQLIRERDVSEADTVTVTKDILAEVFGYDKYLELTGEQQIRGTFCDLAVKLDGKTRYLIEVKAAGVELNENHIRQAVDYGAKEGIEWVVLTNALEWRIYRIKFAQPITHEEVASICLADIDLRREDDQRRVFLLSREAATDGVMDVYHKHSQLLNGYTVGQVVQTDQVLTVIRREMRRLFPDLKVEKDGLAQILVEEVLKREVVESDKAKEAASKVRRTVNRIEKKKAREAESQAETVTPTAAPAQVASPISPESQTTAQA